MSAAATKAARVRRALAGLCRNCDRPAAGEGSQCEACREANRAKYRARKAAGCPRCGAKREAGRVHCARCREAESHE